MSGKQCALEHHMRYVVNVVWYMYYCSLFQIHVWHRVAIIQITGQSSSPSEGANWLSNSSFEIWNESKEFQDKIYCRGIIYDYWDSISMDLACKKLKHNLFYYILSVSKHLATGNMTNCNISLNYACTVRCRIHIISI